MSGIIRKLTAGVAALAISIAATAGARAQEIKLTLADQNSPTAWGPSNALTPWVKQVETATKGRVKLEVYPSQTLIKGIDMWRGVRSGIADIGWCVQSYWPDQTPLSDVIALPRPAVHQRREDQRSPVEALREIPGDAEGIWRHSPAGTLWTTTPFMFITAKKPIRTMDDLKGMKIRVVGAPLINWAKSVGAVPTPMPMPDVYQSLERGVIDIAGGPWEAVHGFRLFEVGQYYTELPLGVAYFSLCANRAKFNSLPADVREQIMSVSGLAGAKFWGKNFFDTAEPEVLARAKAANRPINRAEFSGEELAKFRKSAEPLWEAWVTQMESKGHKDAREVLKTLLQLLQS